MISIISTDDYYSIYDKHNLHYVEIFNKIEESADPSIYKGDSFYDAVAHEAHFQLQQELNIIVIGH